MPHNLDLIFTLAGGLTAACVFGFITQRIGLSPIVGYLIGGVAVGPFTPGYVVNRGIAEQCAEIGVILLMFGVGLHFHVKDLLAVRRVAIPGAVLAGSVATALGACTAHAFGFEWSASIVFGLSISVASTVVLMRVLEDNRTLHTPAGHIALGWLVVEDLLTVLVLVLLPVVVGQGAAPGSAVLSAVFLAMLKIGALIAFTFVVGSRALPLLLGYVAKTRSRELFTLTVLVIALGIAIGSARLFGASMALGAFLAGMVVGQSEFGSRAASEAMPLRDAFSVLFFVSIGMLFDPQQLIESAWLTVGTIGIVVVGKPIAAWLVVRALRYPIKTAFKVAVALAQIGEFSFIVASLGRHLGVLPDSALQALVVTSIFSITVNPMLYRMVSPLVRHLAESDASKKPQGVINVPKDADHAIVVGYGPVGRLVTRVLRDHGFTPVVIELNHETLARLRDEGIDAIYGDASHREILELAGLASARAVLFTANTETNDAAIRLVREQRPKVFVMARAAYASHLRALEQAGASLALSSEIEVALSMTSHLMQHLDATPEQLDSERQRARLELTGR